MVGKRTKEKKSVWQFLLRVFQSSNEIQWVGNMYKARREQCLHLQLNNINIRKEAKETLHGSNAWNKRTKPLLLLHQINLNWPKRATFLKLDEKLNFFENFLAKFSKKIRSYWSLGIHNYTPHYWKKIKINKYGAPGRLHIKIVVRCIT